MQVILNSDPNTDGRDEMAAHVETAVKHALERLGAHVTRVEAHLSDANSAAKATPDDIHCTLEARLSGMPNVVVKGNAPTAHQAIRSAVDKLRRAISRSVEKHESTRSNASKDPLLSTLDTPPVPGKD